MVKNTETNQHREKNQTPENIKEVNLLLDTLDALIQITEIQINQSQSETIKKSKTKDLDSYWAINEFLSKILGQLQFSGNSHYNLSDIIESQRTSLEQQEKQTQNQRQKESIWNQQETLEKTLNFLDKEKQNPSLKSTQDMLAKYHQQDQIKEQETEEIYSQKNLQEAKLITEQLLIQSINDIGRGEIHTSLHPNYSPKNRGGFQSIADAEWNNRRVMFEEKEYMKKNNCREVCTLQAVKESVYAKKEIQPAKKGIFGFGKSEAINKEEPTDQKTMSFVECYPRSNNHEQAYRLSYYVSAGDDDRMTYRDFSNRPGQLLMMNIIIPESIAKKIIEIIKKDPKFIRKLAENRMKKHFTENGKESEFEQAWQKDKIPLRPPYEIWDKAGKKIHFIEY